MLKFNKDTLKDKTIVISGSGNVAQYSCEKATELGAKVITLSDSSGFIYDPDGINKEKLDFVFHLKNTKRGRISEYSKKFGCKFYKNKTPWGIKCDVALPCATQNELTKSDAQLLVKNNCIAVCEGANMPCSIDAVDVFLNNKVLYAPGKASNAGGVAVSGLEMSQNSLRMNWSRDEVNERLKLIMSEIHQNCVKYGSSGETVNYVNGSNISGFIKVADSMIDQGVV